VQVGVGIAQPAGLRDIAQQGLHDRQGEQLGVGQLGGDPDGRPPRTQLGGVLQGVVDGDVQCGGEGVQVGVHRASRLDVGLATPIMDTLATSPHPLESIV
jgi:hypothetical protein